MMYYWVVLYICLFFICSSDYDDLINLKVYEYMIRGKVLKIILLNEKKMIK